MNAKILIADDESDIVSMLGSFFESKGFRVLPAFNGAEALKQVEKQPDIILLDINMPGTDGLEVCKRIRDHISCPILFLTARIEDTDKVNGFAVGGDDYIVKPFSLMELEARVCAHLRREARHNFEAQVKFSGDLTIDYSERCLFFGDKRVGLAKKEFDIVELLSQNPGQIFDKERIYERIWGYDSEGDSSVVAEHIRRIRTKIAAYAAYIYQNAMQSAAFSRFSDLNGNWNGLSVSDVFGNEEIKIGYVDGWLSTSKNMVRVFIALALAVIIMLAPIFSGEYEGVDNIILTSKYGKTKCATAKVVAGILTAILTTALIVAFNLFLARAFYGTEGLNCSILFAPSEYVEAFIPFNITCGTLLKYQILLAFTCTISVTGITLLMSAISKNQIVALVAAMAIFLFPVLLPIPETNPLFRLVGLLPVYHVLAVSLLSVEQMSNGMLYAIWAIPTALIFLGIGAGFSRHIFAKHQVS